MEQYCQRKLEMIKAAYMASLDSEDACFFIEQLFRGIMTAYVKHPGARSCAKIILDFILAAGDKLLSAPRFQELMDYAPDGFSNDLHLALG